MAIPAATNPLNLLDITPQQAGWDATLATDIEALAPQDGVYAGNVKVAQGNATTVEFESLTPVQYPSFAKASLPIVSPAGRQIYVTDDVGGAVMAFTDGTNWRRLTDRAVIA